MRLRNIPNSKERIETCTYMVNEPEKWKGRWRELFPEDGPIHLEIGMGKGRFIWNMAKENPTENFVGVEKFTGVLSRAVRTLEKQERDALAALPPRSEGGSPLLWNNLRYMHLDAQNICDVFDEGEVSTLYLNFSDPWPKKRHAKRRLTSSDFLRRYERILIPGGLLVFKTDNRKFFDFSLSELGASHWELQSVVYGVHSEARPTDKFMTEYEERFVRLGCPIYQFSAYF